MLAHGLVDERQPKPRPFLLGGEEGLESLFALQGTHPRSGVANENPRAAIALCRGDMDLAFAGRQSLQRVDAVENEIEYRLLEGVLIGPYDIRSETHLQGDIALLEVETDKVADVCHKLTEAHGPRIHGPRPREVQQVGDDAIEPVCLAHHGLGVGFIGLTPHELLREILGEAAQGTQRVANLVGDACRQSPERRQFFGLTEVLLKFPNLRTVTDDDQPVVIIIALPDGQGKDFKVRPPD